MRSRRLRGGEVREVSEEPEAKRWGGEREEKWGGEGEI